jgi:cellulase/cellobiase CelA1
MSRIGRLALGLVLTVGCVVAPVAGTPAASAAAEQYACAVDYDASGHTGGFNAKLHVKNTGIQPVRGWTLTFPLGDGVEIVSVWNAELVVSKGQIETRSLKWNADVEPGKYITLGFGATGPLAAADPAPFKVNGITCTSAEIE